MLPMLAAQGGSLALRELTKKRSKKRTIKSSLGGGRRRRRARLTQGDIMELTHIKNILGKTAAANALPFYLGRGRG